MNKDIYPFQNIEGDFIYIFISEGIHGEILKVVLITPLPDDLGDDFKPQYNLGFGDLFDIGEGWIVNDAVRSGNGDMPKVIATVAKIGMEMNNCMEKNKEVEYEARMAELLKDKDKIIEAVRNSPFF